MSRWNLVGKHVLAVLRWIVPDFVRRSYALKFAAVFVLLGVLIGGTGLLATQTFAEDVRENADQQLAEIASQEAQQIRSWLQRHFDNARLVAPNARMVGDDPEPISERLDVQIGSLPPSVLRVHYVDTARNHVVASTNDEFQDTPLSAIDEQWAAGLPFEGDRHVSSPYTSLGVTRIALSQRLFDRPDRAIVMEIETRGAATTLGGAEGAPGLGYAEVLTAGGQVVFGERPSRTGQRYDGTGSGDTVKRAVLSQTPGTFRSEGNEFISRELDVDSYLISHAPVDGVEWAVLVHASQDEVYGFAQQVIFFGLIGTGIGLVFVGLLGVLLGKHTSTAIDRLVEKANQMEKGNLTVEFNTQRIDNIGRLYREFDRAQVALREHIEQAALVEHSYELITVIDPDGTVTYQSPSSEHILGVDPAEIEGRQLLEMVHDDDRDVVGTGIKEALEHPDHEQRFEFSTRNAAGEWRYLHGVCENHCDNPFVEGLIVSSRDVTERKQHEQELQRTKEELEESNEKLEQFAYVASHDLQEPLRMVSSYVKLLEAELEDDLEEELEEYLAFAVDGADRMRAMIDDLLQYSRVQTRAEPFEAVDAGAVLTDTLRDLELKIEQTETQVETGELPTVSADPTQLGQLFQNLIKNAIEHGGENTHIAVTATEREDATEFAVADDGPGIPDHRQNDIFGIFEKGGDSDGTGIGLAVCQQIVERHGGDIRVESTEGEGTTVYFTIPDEPG